MPVQRWRLTFKRGEAASGRSQRDIDTAWESALAGFRPERSANLERPRLVIGAPLAVGMTAGHELADLLLPEQRRMLDVREVLEPRLPADHRLVDLHDVWVGEPTLPGLVVAGDYRVALAASGDADRGVRDPFQGIREAARTLLDATDLPRARTKAGRTTAGNLRPLILEVAVVEPVMASNTLDLWMRLRFHPSQGTGRPDEVVAALSSILGQPLRAVRCHRERLWLRGELPEWGIQARSADAARSSGATARSNEHVPFDARRAPL